MDILLLLVYVVMAVSCVFGVVVAVQLFIVGDWTRRILAALGACVFVVGVVFAVSAVIGF